MYQRILVAVDDSPPSRCGLAQAIAMAKLTHGQLRLVHVVDAAALAMAPDTVADEFEHSDAWIRRMRQGGQKLLAAARSRVEAAGVPVEAVLREGRLRRVGESIVEEAMAWHADLVVIGSHGRRGVLRLVLGSDAELVARLAPVPVLVVRGTAERVS